MGITTKRFIHNNVDDDDDYDEEEEELYVHCPMK